MDTLETVLQDHPFLTGLADVHLNRVAGCAHHRRFKTDQYLFREDGAADEFYLILAGRVVLEAHVPGRAPIVFSTMGPEEIVGISWLLPPYRWTFDARALEPVRALGIDVACLRAQCEADHELGYAVMQGLLPTLVKRLHATRVQMFDVYGQPEP